MLTAGLNCVTVVNVTKYGYVGECVCVCIRVHMCVNIPHPGIVL